MQPPEAGADRRPDVCVVGLSHASAPVDLLERVTADGVGGPELVASVRAATAASGVLVLGTCNRVEIYTEAPDPATVAGTLLSLLARRAGVPEDELARYAYVHRGQDATRHLFDVAAGLDSVVVGEDQILGQVRAALEQAQAAGHAGSTLQQMGQSALRVGKRVRSETTINSAGRSLATVGIAYFERLVGTLAGQTGLIVGAGSMASVVAADLRRAGVDRCHVVNRTPERAERLAATMGGRGAGLDQLPDLLADVDVVVACAGGGELVVTADDVAHAVKERAGRPLFLLDLALPRNIDPAAAAVDSVRLVDLESLAVGGPDADRAAVDAVAGARDIVSAEVAKFHAGQLMSRAAPVVSALRSAASVAMQSELHRLSRRIPSLDPGAHEEIASSVRRIVDKILHTPTMRARELAGQPSGEVYVEALDKLFQPANER